MIGWIKSFFGAEKKEEAVPATGQQAAPAVAPTAQTAAPAPAAPTEAPIVPAQAGGARRKHRASHRKTKRGGALNAMGFGHVGGRHQRHSKKRHTRRHRK